MGTFQRTETERKVCQHMDWRMVASLVPPTVVQEILTDLDAWEKREKKINMPALVYVLLGLHLFAHQNMREVWRSLREGQHALGERLPDQVPTKGALSQRRAQLGVAPMRELCARVVHPLATAATKGAFAFNLRLVAVDGTLDDLPDTLANRTVFPPPGGLHSSRLPQLRCTLLSECGTHAFLDVHITSIHEGEQGEALLLLERSLSANMLLLWDSGFRDVDLLILARRKDAHVLGRLPHGHLTHPWAALSDGTYLAEIPEDIPHRRGHVMTVRILEYTLPGLPQVPEGRVSRLVTTLLDPQQYPAEQLIALSHERWEIERGLDEYKHHLRLASTPLRSTTPQGVEQELSSLLLTHVLVRSVIHLAALAENLDPDRLSFPHTVQILRRALPRFSRASLSDLPLLRFQLLQDILEERVPERLWRLQPRARKHARSPFPSKPAGPAPTILLPKPFRSSIHVLRT